MVRKRIKRLTRFEKRIAASFAETMAPPGVGFSLCAKDIDTTGWLDEYMQKSIPMLRAMALFLFTMLEICPLFFGFGPKRFTSLTLEKRDLYLNKWRDLKIYPFNMVVILVRLLICLSIYQDERVLIELGYDLPRMRELAVSEKAAE